MSTSLRTRACHKYMDPSSRFFHNFLHKIRKDYIPALWHTNGGISELENKWGRWAGGTSVPRDINHSHAGIRRNSRLTHAPTPTSSRLFSGFSALNRKYAQNMARSRISLINQRTRRLLKSNHCSGRDEEGSCNPVFLQALE